MRFGSGKGRKGTFEDVAAMVREVLPAIGERGNRPDRLNFFLLALEADDAKGRAHTRDFGNEQFGHEATRTDLRRGFAGFWRDEMRWRISTASPRSRQRAARRSATRRRWHFSGPGSEQSRETLGDHEDVSRLAGTPRSF